MENNKLVSQTEAMPTATMPDTVFSKIPEAKATQLSNMFYDTALMNTIYATAKMLSKSGLLPKEYQGNEGSCFIACELAARVGLSPIMVAQNLHPVNGRPSWSGQMCTTLVNQSRRYDKPLKIRFVDKQGKDMPRYIQGQTEGAYAYATQGEDEFFGTCVTWELANKEGWVNKSGSKWQSMPEQMFKYRASSFFAREHCPDLLFGCAVEGEAEDIQAAMPEVKAVQDIETAKNVLEGIGGSEQITIE